jgi:ABC-type nitrate/sulfonate/bicarbonate transport system permease component
VRRHAQWPDWVWTGIGIVLVLGIWQTYGQFTNPFLFPSFTRVMDQLWLYAVNGVLLKAVFETMILLFAGLAVGSVVGVIAGLIIGSNRNLSAIFAPFIQVAYSTPRIALIPLIILWAGIGFYAQVVLVFLSCVFEILTATEAGASQVARQYREVSRSFRLGRFSTFMKVTLPGSIPYIFAGIRLGMGGAFIGAVGAQLFMQATGVGVVLKQAMQSFRTDRVMACIILLAVIAAVLTAGMRHIERRLAPWRAADVVDD